jgi:DNA-binding winged helix-turn-helix (wHTH) protein/TolB-like protein
MTAAGRLRIDDWVLDPALGQISRCEQVVRLEARTLRLLQELAEHPGEVVSIDQLLDRVWAGVIVTPDSVYQAVAALRRLLGDDPKRPRYIATVPRLGYRLVAPVSPAPGGLVSRRRRIPLWVNLWIVGALVTSTSAVVLTQVFVHAAAKRPVGVMPFLDLTDGMDNIKISDDLTEGVIDRLAKNPRLKTPGFRDSFLLRGRHLTPRQAARTLGVDYIVDGALHSSPLGVRVTARLVRADNGFVVWSQAFEGPAGDAPRYEDAIAAGIGRTLRR